MYKLEKLSSVREITVIETVGVIGTGTEKDPVRTVSIHWDLDGNMLAVNDSLLIKDLEPLEKQSHFL